MKKRVLRLLLGLGYVVLLTTLLLYQAGTFARARQWEVAVLGTLLLGVAIAVVLALYIRVNDQIGREERAQRRAGTKPGEGMEEEKQIATRYTSSLSEGSYEERYACFLAAVEASELSERELEVAWLLYRGYTNRQIGEELFIAETTVKKHVSHIYQKLEVCSRKEFRAHVQTVLTSSSV